MKPYDEAYMPLFDRNLKRYQHLRRPIYRLINRILASPYHNTERLTYMPGGLDLRGCRSARVNRNFRIIFVICEECRCIPACQYCFCDDRPDNTVVFLNVGPHERVYAMREPQAEYAGAIADHSMSLS